MTPKRLLVVGSSGGSHIGESLLRAATKLGLTAQLYDANAAWSHGTFKQKLLWHFVGRRPVKLLQFSRQLLEHCRSLRPDVLIATGMAPISRTALNACREMGIRCLNFSTDDPFNPRMRAPWFLSALGSYDIIFTPRHANEDELRQRGCCEVRYLRFGFDSDLFERSQSPEKTHDLFFAGAIERSRVELLTAAAEAGFTIRLHGHGWDRIPRVAAIAQGIADVATIRAGISSSHVALCVVRRDNRDDHSMRTFELPAVGACMVVEDTAEHREIFGPDDECVRYFRTTAEMLRVLRSLLANREERKRLLEAAYSRIHEGRHTYVDRLASMLGFAQKVV